MFKIVSIALVAASLSSSVSAYTLHFTNNCAYTIWPAVAAAPNGQPDLSVQFGAEIAAGGGQTSYSVAQSKPGVRSWARTGCDASGSNCQTGANVGGLYPTDAGLQSNAIYFESGPNGNYGDVSWNLSHVGVAVNVPLTVTNAGNTKTCADVNCPRDQAFAETNDFQAVTSSPDGTFEISYC